MHQITTLPSGNADVLAAKIAMRESAIAMRAAMSPAVRGQGAATIAAMNLPPLIGPPATIVSAFRSLGDELDTGPLLSRLAADHYRLCLPVMQGKGEPLVFRAWKPGDTMRKAVWGIEEPTAEQPELEPDVLLVPLLAFDSQGWRLGYGGGFFDRTLQRLRTRKTIRAIGLAFSEQEVDAVPHLDYDERLDAVLTPRGLIEFGAQQSGDDAASLSR